MSDDYIPYGRQDISRADIDAVVEVLQSDWLTQGPAVPAFERAIAESCGAAHGVAVNSATSALHLACLALGVGPGDTVWTTPNTFVATANCARLCGAMVDFVDIDAHTWCMSTESLRSKLDHARRNKKPLPKVVIPVHFAGQSCDMAGIAMLSKEYGFHIVEDASHALGGSYKGAKVGSCLYGDVTVFSFHPVKSITTGEGGMALTNNAAIAERMSRLRAHGITRDPALMARSADGPWYYEQIELGFNYRMTDIQAALGLSQLTRLAAFVVRRNTLASMYDAALAGMPVMFQQLPAEVSSSRHLYVIRVAANWHRTLFDQLRRQEIGVNLHYIPLHLQPEYRRLGFREGQYPQAEQYYREAMSLPIFSAMTNGQHSRVVEEVTRVMERVGRVA